MLQIAVVCHFNCGNPENKCTLQIKCTNVHTLNPNLAKLFLLGFCNCCFTVKKTCNCLHICLTHLSRPILFQLQGKVRSNLVMLQIVVVSHFNCGNPECTRASKCINVYALNPNLAKLFLLGFRNCCFTVKNTRNYLASWKGDLKAYHILGKMVSSICRYNNRKGYP
jgi:hypothetical protein